MPQRAVAARAVVVGFDLFKHGFTHLGAAPEAKEEIAAIIWLGANVAHSITADVYTTSLELESKLPDGEEILDLAEQATDYTGVLAWYWDEKTGKESKVTAGDQTQPKRLTALYTSKAAAERVVEREWKKIQTGQE